MVVGKIHAIEKIEVGIRFNWVDAKASRLGLLFCRLSLGSA